MSPYDVQSIALDIPAARAFRFQRDPDVDFRKALKRLLPL